ncbi:MAG: methyltransferase domain-containing protein [Planctomycetes bacterium]|jgi:precorrin-6B methylase 2|nr:methyltransferase domain-containing protein [Planctomycetota bacterium]
MCIRDVMCVLVVMAFGVAGCASDDAPPQAAASSTVDSARQADSTAGSAAAQPASPGVGIAPKGQPKTGTAAGSASASAPAQSPAAPTASSATEPVERPKRPDVIFVPTPDEVVAKMLELARVTSKDVVYDLGCGDGRIVVAAAKLGCLAYGFDVDPQRIKESKENVAKNGVGNRATIEQKDIFTLDLSKADVVTLYLLPSLNVKLIPQLEKLKPGSRIVSHDFDMQGVTPDKVEEVDGQIGAGHTVYLWTAPLKKEAQTE